MKYELDPNQKKALHFHKQLSWSFNCMEMGEGKSLTALEYMKNRNIKDLLIFCPAYLKHNWESEIKKFNFKFDNITIQSYASRKVPKYAQGVILDEFHYIKNPSAKRTNRIYDWVKKKNPRALIGLSGTPMKTSALDFFPYFSILRLKHPSLCFPRNHYAFQEVYCRKVKNDFTPTGYSFEGVNEENKEKLKDIIKEYFYFTPSDLKPRLPETNNRKYIGGTKGKVSDLMAIALKENKSKEFMTLKALNAEENVKTTVRLIDDLLEQNIKPVVFSEHRKSAELIAQKYKTKAIIGGVSDSVRVEILSDFGKDNSSVLIGTYGAMSAGLNITSTNHMIFNDYSFSPSDYDQAKKRIHRKGQTKPCFYHHVFSNDLDYSIFKRLIKKKEETDDMHQRKL